MQHLQPAKALMNIFQFNHSNHPLKTEKAIGTFGTNSFFAHEFYTFVRLYRLTTT